jgi:HSP20 family molecular chaperone IbpA
MLARIDNSLARRDYFSDFVDEVFRYPLFSPKLRTLGAWSGFSYSEDRATLTLDVPGIKKDDLDISIADRVVSVEAKRGKREFKGIYELDHSYDPSTASAVLEDGVLTLTFERLPETKPKKIEITVR